MRSVKDTIIGYFFFLVSCFFSAGVALVTYKLLINETPTFRILMVIVSIILTAALFSIIDYFRRKIMIGRPLKEIQDATRLMAKGDFEIRLTKNHSVENYDEFDYIKDDLNKMAQELSKSEVLKNDFIANVSHEIKTPLSVIQSYAKLLENPALHESDKKRYLKSLQDACKNLSTLVTNILKLNKLEHQKLLPELKRYNLSESLINQILQYEELIENKSINLNCDIEEDVYITSEESYLDLIWNNLVSNAIKFTNANGNITISLKKDKDKVIVKVADDGIGISQEHGHHIFDKFYQADTSHYQEGNGLGLALVKKVIDILGGTIYVESEENKGSTFTVELSL